MSNNLLLQYYAALSKFVSGFKSFYQWLKLDSVESGEYIDYGTGGNNAAVVSGTMEDKDLVLNVNPDGDTAISTLLDAYGIPNPEITYAEMAALKFLDHTFVEEDRDRVANFDYESIFESGTIRTVGDGGEYSTILAAYYASASGDIIQLIDGEFDIANEPGGYLLFNQTGKRILIQGNSSDNAACLIKNISTSSYGIRMRDTGALVFKNLSIYSDQNNPLIYIGGSYADKNFICDNCIINNSSVGSSSRLFQLIDSKTYDKHIEFKNCTLNKSGDGYLMFLAAQYSGNQYLFDSCEIISEINHTLLFTGSNECAVSIYDSTLKQTGSNSIIAQFGEDTATPTNQMGLIDLRGNTFEYENDFFNHGLLLGRGVNKKYVVNNQVYLPSINDSLALGIVDKTISTQLSDSYLAGNYVEAPRPYYIKGGRYNDVQFNSFVCNNSEWESFGFVNYYNDGNEILSENNRVINNNLVGLKYCLRIYNTTGESQDGKTSAKTCQIDYNKVYYLTNYIGDSVGLYSFEDRTTFWGDSDNDSNSELIGFYPRLPMTNNPDQNDFSLNNSEEIFTDWALQPYQKTTNLDGNVVNLDGQVYNLKY